MKRVLQFVIPGDLYLKTGGYAYDRRMIEELRRLRWDVGVIALSPAFPCPDAQALDDADEAFGALDPGSLVLVDGLAFGAMPEILEAHADRLRLAVLVHHPLDRETGLLPQAADALFRSERRALGLADAVVATGHATARDLLERFGVLPERLTVAMPGTDTGILAKRGGTPPLILSVGTLTRRKDHATLIAALALIADLEWRCRIVGSAERDPEVAAELGRRIAEAGLAGRVTLTSEVDDLAPEWADADIFALASRHEGYGMVFAEALSHGLPIVGCAAGAVPDVVPETAGILVSPGDAPAFAAALARLVADPSLRAKLSAGAARAGAELPSWGASAKILSDCLEGLGA